MSCFGFELLLFVWWTFSQDGNSCAGSNGYLSDHFLLQTGQCWEDGFVFSCIACGSLTGQVFVEGVAPSVGRYYYYYE